jgi:hypothetical protein
MPRWGIRHARPAGTAAGLGRRTPNGPERLPSDRLGPRGPSGLRRARCSLARLHPAPCHLPRAGPASSRLEGRFRLSHRPLPAGYPTARDAGGKDASLRLLQPTLRHEHPTDCPIPERTTGPTPLRAWPRAVPTHRPSKTSGGSPGRASLDGEPPASASPQPARPCPGFGPRATALPQHHAVLAEPRSKRSSARRFPAAAFSAACRACGMASDVLCRRSPRSAPTFRSDPSVGSRQARFPELLVKDARFNGTRTPSLDERPLPRSGSCPAYGLRRLPDTLRPGLSALSPGP